MSVKKWSSHDVYEALKDVTLGGKICLYTPEICEKLAPKINRILELKEDSKIAIEIDSNKVPFILFDESNYYAKLKTKMGWYNSRNK